METVLRRGSRSTGKNHSKVSRLPCCCQDTRARHGPLSRSARHTRRGRTTLEGDREDHPRSHFAISLFRVIHGSDGSVIKVLKAQLDK